MTSASIPGQEELKHVFRQMADEARVPHAMLIHANEGGSGLPLAIYLTQMLLCESREACGHCPALHANARLYSPRCTLHLSCKYKQDRKAHRRQAFGQFCDRLANGPFRKSVFGFDRLVQIDRY